MGELFNSLLREILTADAVRSLLPLLVGLGLAALLIISIADYTCGAIKSTWPDSKGRHWALTLLPLVVGVVAGLILWAIVGEAWAVGWGLLWGLWSSWGYKRLIRIRNAGADRIESRIRRE